MFCRFRNLLFASSALVPLGFSPAIANPLGAQVVGGGASVNGQGTAHVTVMQSTDKAIINWKTFNIGAGEKTEFIQPGASSIALNRVNGGLGPSQIYGNLSANGRVFLVNPDGILVGPGGVINTAGFLGTTHDIANADFMAGRYNFSVRGNPSASVINEGRITAQSSGFAALVAPGVRNSGTITARLGTIGLASGNAFTLDFYGDKLITLGVTDSIAAKVKDVATGKPLSALVSNKGRLKANGGTVELTAVAARRVVDSVINNKGVIEANTIGSHNGKIVLGGPTARTKLANTPAQVVKVSGRLEASGGHAGTAGGQIQITGEKIVVAAATIDASGRDGGGTILIGGDTGGGHPGPAAAAIRKAKLEPNAVPTATSVSVDMASTIDASAKDNGDGGKVIVWADGATSFDGAIAARGGALSGNGGFVETSGHRQLSFTGTVDTKAPNGKGGTLLLDPLNATIAANPGTETITVSAIQSALASNDVVVVGPNQTGSEPGDLTVAASLNWTTPGVLILAANRDVIINNGVTISNVGAGSLTLQADVAATGTGTVSFNGTGKVDFSGSTGSVSIIYNPAGGYANPTNFAPNVVQNGAVVSQLRAAMLVNNVNDLQNISQNLAGDYAFVTNIDASATASWNGGAGFIPIGDTTTPFTGSLTGAVGNAGSGVVIDHLTIHSSIPDVGLFGAIGSTGMVSGVGLTNISVQGGLFTGGLAGVNNGTISRSYVTGNITSTAPGATGGLVGLNGNPGDYSLIDQSYSSATVFHSTAGPVPSATGGLVGQNNTLIQDSYATGAATEISIPLFPQLSVGGLVGHNAGVIKTSYATGAVTGLNTDAHGLVGGNSAIGGVVGLTSVQNSYWDTQTTGQATDAAANGFGVFNSTGLTTADLKSGVPNGFDSTVWAISSSVNSGYPYLQWQTGNALSSAVLQPSASSPTSTGPSTQAVLAAFGQQTGQTNAFTLKIDTTVAGSTPQFIPTNAATNGVSLPTTQPATAPVLQGTPNDNGDKYIQVAGLDQSGQMTTTWGWKEGKGLVRDGGTTPYKPIDSMTVVVNGQTKTLNAYANVKANGTKDATDGAFQCTALVAEYLSDLGFKNAPASLPNGAQVAEKLGTGPNKEYFDFSRQHAPVVGSIISMATNHSEGHVAIVKGVTMVNENTITLALLEQNMTTQGQNTFAVNRQVTLTKGPDGTWIGTHQMSVGGPAYSILNWVTPIQLP